MNKGVEIARGKTKVLYEMPGQPDVLIAQGLDAITAGDGARRDEIPGKGRVAMKTTSRIFRLLNRCGVPTHYLSGGEDDDDNEMLVRRCTMIPLEVVVRGVAAGSHVTRKPGIQRGSVIVPRMIEFFAKDDANHDPLIEPDTIVRNRIATPPEIGTMGELARIVFEILAHAWRRHETLLVDLKIEFGRLASGEQRGALVIADVIDNDAWRIWPQGREDLMLDKQVYRNLTEVTPAALARVSAAYDEVSELVGSFPQMRPGIVVLVADGPQLVPSFEPVARALQLFGLPTMQRVVSSTLTPGFVLQLVQQLDASFPRVVYVSASGGDLSSILEAATQAPVFEVRGADPERLALAVAKVFALDDTVLFGRTMLVQANSRSAVLQADAAASAPPDANQSGMAVA